MRNAQDLTHAVTNQPPEFIDINLFDGDSVLRHWVDSFGGDWGAERLGTYGELAGGRLMELGFQANAQRPVLRSHDRFGHRMDQVEFHPAYHEIMATAIAHGVPSLPWNEPGEGAQVVRAALMYLHGQAEAATCCPLTMTYASVPALRNQPEVAEQWLPKILSGEYDSRFLPIAEKSGATIGMGMTEKQGGSDVRSNATAATAIGGEGAGEAYTLVGHKWFFSAPMCDAFLVLAQAERGLSCFLVPRFRPDGSQNAIRIQRLKDKLGDHANASSEVEFYDAWGVMVGPEGRGVPTIIEMVMHTRLDCMIGSSALMRQALSQAIHHASHREAFGRTIVDQPLMQNVLADLALESEAAIAMTLRLASALDAAGQGDEEEAALARIMTAIGKYWICKRTPMMVNEAQECLGGAGYVEESILPRLYRQAPLNSIWEGSGNIQCLDVLRALAREAGALPAITRELGIGAAESPALAERVEALGEALKDTQGAELRARSLVEELAVCLQASLLVRSAPQFVADAFLAGRFESGRVFGTLPTGLNFEAIIDRARVPL
ncbi:acyl-CoA dehydrogenase family protein [uncultured Abyssibacter sp.]|uniref:acyl-CoA dehydrogenase family protein n=1 Tax=uncultured Abyssibacter sp. TaxID=2320202 RepID=UPI0032B151F7